MPPHPSQFVYCLTVSFVLSIKLKSKIYHSCIFLICITYSWKIFGAAIENTINSQTAFDFEIICRPEIFKNIRDQIKKFSKTLGKKNNRGFMLKIKKRSTPLARKK